MAQLGKKTLLLDADLRRPTIHTLFGMENATGLSDIIIGEREPNETIRSSGIANLDIITCGTIPPSPSELLGSESMSKLIEKLRDEYEIILFDTPPILSVMDALVLGQHMDGLALITRSGSTTIPSVKQSLEKLEEREIRMLGVVLNDFDVSTYYSKYGYYLAKGDEDGEEEESLQPT